jgi:alpha-tubulin suppressor-like RCC1 family protein
MNRIQTAAVKFLCVYLVLVLFLLTALSASPGHAATSVLSFGSNSGGQTGLGTTSGNALIATPIDMTNFSGHSIKQVAAGRHSLLLADDGTVFSFGRNSNGQTGLGTTSGDTPVAVPINATNLASKTITQVAAGDFHSLLLADDGSVFSFGSNEFGQTGLNFASLTSTPIATPIDTSNLAGRRIAQVSAGEVHSLLLADDGTVFSFGSNAHGKTGNGMIAGNTVVATEIDKSNLGERQIIQVSAGQAHSLLLADDGTVYSFGSNEFGQTGQGTTSGSTLMATPIDTTNLGGKIIIGVSANDSHSLLLADDGAVFSFGTNIAGRTGLGTSGGNTAIATPIVTTNLIGKKITKISAGGAHSLLLADDGAVFSFGSNSNGRTGLGAL